MARVPHLAVDPAGDTASLLRRVGFGVLMLGLPFGALASASGLVIAAAIGLVLVCAAAAFDSAARPVRESAGRLAGSPAAVAVAVLVAWAVLSLLWTPFPGPTASRLVATLLVAAVALAGFLALPDRMRSANLYLAPIGAAAGALVAVGLAYLDPEGDGDADRDLERGIAVLVLYAWPAIAWLRSRGRDLQAVALALAVVVAAALGPDPVLAPAFAAGALAYLAVQLLGGRIGLAATGLLLALLLLAAPAFAAFGVAPLRASLARFPAWLASMDGWRAAILQEPARLLTGHGLGSFRRGLTHALSGSGFGAPALVLWYDLGIVGVAAVATALWGSLRSIVGASGPLVPGLAAAFATGFVLALSGIDRGETWWPAALLSVALVFVAAERGQFRTKRPRFSGFGRAAAPAPSGQGEAPSRPRVGA